MTDTTVMEYTPGDPMLRPRFDFQVPQRMQTMKRDERGFIVPWFVPWINGVPEFRAFDGEKFNAAITRDLCWLCGDRLGKHKIFVVGPMCVINRISAEPPCHIGCAEYAAKVCPFLTQPKAKRNEKTDWGVAIEDRKVHPAANPRNPGVVALYGTNGFGKLKSAGHILLEMAAPTQIGWWTKSRAANQAEVITALEEGVAVLRKAAFDEGGGQAGLDEIERQYRIALQLIPVAA